MRVIKARFHIEKINGNKILRSIEKAGKTCYQSEHTITKDIQSAKDFVKMIIRNGHESVLEHEKVTVRVICDRGVCYSEDTKVLTENGWKLFSEIKKTDRVYTKDEKNNLILSNPLKLIREKYSGKMIHIHNTQLDFLVTPNHNLWVFDYNKRSSKTKTWKFIKSEKLCNKRYLFSKGAIFIGESPKTIKVNDIEIERGYIGKKLFKGIEGDSKSFMKFLGIWVTDGSLGKRSKDNGRRITISQKKTIERNEIEHLLLTLNLKYSKHKNDYRICHCPLYNFLEKNFIQNNDYKKSYYIKIPSWIKNLSPGLLNEFLDGVILGDGTPHAGNAGGYQIYTASLPFAEDLIEIALKCGKAANIYFPKFRVTPGKIQQRVPQYVVSIVKTTNVLLNKSSNTYEEIIYDGYVYCVELLKHHRLYVMRNGKPGWCGNSHEIVRHRIASYSQESTRYCNYTKAVFGKQITVINIKPHIMGGNPLKEWRQAMKDAEEHYFNLIGFGVKPQIARSVLPNSLKTEIVITYNLREWRHFFRLRAESEKAHPQMRDIMVPLLWEFKKKIPVVFDDIMNDDEEERRSKMVTLDFSKCKTPEDVEKVFAEHKKEFDAIKKGIKKL